MARRKPKRPRDSNRGQKVLTLFEAAARIGIEPTDLIQVIREAGLAQPGPEAEWRLGVEEVAELLAERERTSARNEAELEKLRKLGLAE